MSGNSLRVFTWHIHGSYLYYLTHCGQQIYVPVKPGWPAGYSGRAGQTPWPDNLHEVPAEQVRDMPFDCILYQSRKNYLADQYEILSQAQRNLPRIYLEHDPPREHPTDTRHFVDNPDVLLVHVTHFNNLMWDNGRTPTRVVEHGVVVPRNVKYTGEIGRGLVVINNLGSRGRRLGADIFAQVREQIPLDLIGMGAAEMSGLGEIPHHQLASFAARYRFFFNPIRYTSLGLAVIEAMMVGLPIIGLATTEMVTAIQNGVSGYVDTNPDKLVAAMRRLLADPAEAHALGQGAQRYAQEHFNIERFGRDWAETFALVTGKQPAYSA